MDEPFSRTQLIHRNDRLKMDYYGAVAGGYNELHGSEQLRKLRIIKELLDLKKSDSVLDVGCGTGLSKILGCKLVGIDSSEELIKQAPFPAIRGAAENLPFDDKTFDAVVSVTAVHNFQNPEKALKEMKRVLKGNGKAAVTLLKKSKRFYEIKGLIKREFDVEEFDEGKDTIFYTAK